MPIRFDKPIEAWFGEEVITISPLRGLKNIQAFEQALTEEIFSFKDRLDSGDFKPSNPQHLFSQSVDVVRLLKLACPILTDELIDMSTPKERIGVLVEATKLNGMGHLTVFFQPSTLLEVALKMRAMSTDILMKEFGTETFEEMSPSLEYNATSLVLASHGETSTTTSPSGKS